MNRIIQVNFKELVNNPEKELLQEFESEQRLQLGRLAGLTAAGSMMYSKTRLRRFDKQQSCLASWNHS
jgi:hypothetical protein